MTFRKGKSDQISRFQDRQQHIQELEDALEEEGTKAERAENALLDCQEMLEEIQAFSEHQALQIAAGCQDAQVRSSISCESDSEDFRHNICMDMMSDFG